MCVCVCVCKLKVNSMSQISSLSTYNQALSPTCTVQKLTERFEYWMLRQKREIDIKVDSHWEIN